MKRAKAHIATNNKANSSPLNLKGMGMTVHCPRGKIAYLGSFEKSLLRLIRLYSSITKLLLKQKHEQSFVICSKFFLLEQCQNGMHIYTGHVTKTRKMKFYLWVCIHVQVYLMFGSGSEWYFLTPTQNRTLPRILILKPTPPHGYRKFRKTGPIVAD